MTSDQVDRDAIGTVLQEHVDAVNTTDVELLLKGFTDDVVYIGPGAAPILGKSAMREYITPIYAQASIQLAMKSESLEIAGDRATEWRSCHGQLTLDGGDRISVNLHYMFAYRREPSGDWRISHDISTPGPE